MERIFCFVSLPDVPFLQILKYLNRGDILSLSLVSSALRGRIRQLSNTLQTFEFTGINPVKLRQLADTVEEIKGVTMNLPSEDTAENWDECVQHLLRVHPELEAFTVDHCQKPFNLVEPFEPFFIVDKPFNRVEPFISLASFQSLISHRNMKYLDLGYTEMIQEGSLDYDLKCSGKLLRLKLGRSVVTDSNIEFILGRTEGPNRLQALSLNQCPLLTDIGLSHIFILAPQLKSLRLFEAGITDTGLMSVLRPMENLKKLIFETCEGVTDTGLCNFLRYAPRLTTLYLRGTRISGQGLAWKNMSTMQNLQVLGLDGCAGLTDEGLGAILSQTRNLRALRLNVLEITDEAFIDPLVKLETLDIYVCYNLTTIGVSAVLGPGTNLKTLSLYALDRSEDGLNSQVPLSKLETLVMADCSLPDTGLCTILQQAPNLAPNLKNLYLFGLPISDIGLALENPLIKLELLHIAFCDEVTDVGVSSILSKTPQISSLLIDGLRIHGSDLNIPVLSKLESVWLTDCKLFTVDGVITFIRSAPNLKEFKLIGTTGIECGNPALEQYLDLIKF